MSESFLTIPQLGEGLQEARVVAFLKNPGDHVKRDEPVYQMETDKAVLDVESPFEGELLRWEAKVDDVLEIGARVGVVATSGEVAATPQVETVQESRRRTVPPRTRAYAASKGLSDSELESVPSSGDKLMPEDIDAYLALKGSEGPTGYQEVPLSSRQKILSSRLTRGAQTVVPGVMTVSVDWTEIEALRAESDGTTFSPSAFTYFAFAVAKAAASHPVVRSTLVGEVVRTYDHVNMGIAVSLKDGDLVVAVVDEADKMGWREFAEAARHKILLAREGNDQAHQAVTLSVTNMSAHGIRDAAAVVVPPAVATVFLGEAHWGFADDSAKAVPQRRANVGITIDHRLINGVPGAEFLREIKRNVEKIRELIGGD